MWVPVALGPVGAAAGVAGFFFSRRLAKTALPVASAAIVANGLQGTYLHARGIAQKPGGWANARYNLEMGPPLLAPLLVTMVGAGWACWPRSCGASSEPRPGPPARDRGSGDRRSRDAGRRPGTVPPVSTSCPSRRNDPATASVVQSRLGPPPPLRFFSPAEEATATALLNLILGQDDEPRVPVTAMIDERLAGAQTDGWRYASMPEDGQAWRGHARVPRRRRAGQVRGRVRRLPARRPDRADPGGPGSRLGRRARPARQPGVEPVDPLRVHRLLRPPLVLERDGLSRLAYPRGYKNRGTDGGNHSSRPTAARPRTPSGRANDDPGPPAERVGLAAAQRRHPD